MTQIAIVGSGPSGCYLGQALHRALPEAELTIFDQYPTPYGLIRYGVAADHQSTKAVTRQFDRLFQSERVRFAGNVQLGSDVSLTQLRELFDVVVLATGSTQDRSLAIPGAQLAHVIPAGQVVWQLNSVPDTELTLTLRALGPRVVIIGGGNVAIDLLRFLIKTEPDYLNSDIHDTVLDHHVRTPVTHVEIFSRSPVERAKSDAVMIKELGQISGVSFASADVPATPVGEAEDPRAAAVLELIDPARQPSQPRVHVQFHFGWSPSELLDDGSGNVAGARFSNEHGQEYETAANTVLTAIGFELPATLPGEPAEQDWSATSTESAPSNFLTPLQANNESGRLLPPDLTATPPLAPLYRTGWIRRGTTGTIPTNRMDAKLVSEEILADLNTQQAPATRPGWAGLPEAVHAKATTFAQWQLLDAHEHSIAPAHRIRRKIGTTTEMLAIINSASPESE